MPNSLHLPTPVPATLRVLLVEDDADTRANIRDILELDGYLVSVVGTLAEAKSAAASPFDVVILDRRLPDGNADEILPDLVRWWPTSEIIVVTGFAELDSTIAAFRYGVADYILKPINPQALRQSLRRIVQRHEIESELQREQQFADRMLQTAEAVVLVLGIDGRVVQFNPFFERLSGWQLQEVVGQDWFDRFIPKEDRERIREAFLEIAMGATTTSMVNPVLTRDGRLRQVRWSNTVLKDPSGNVTSVLAVGIDITDMLAAQAKSLQSERLAAIGKTMAALAHESRNALQRIQAGLEMLELELPNQPEVQKDLGSIRRATTDLQSVLEEVRSFAAPILLYIEPTNLQILWQRVWRQLHAGKRNNRAVLIEPDPPIDLNIPVDVMRMEQVFRNLFENAIAAIELVADEDCQNPCEIRLACRRGIDGGIALEITDCGPGFGDADHQQLFEPFYTTKPTGTGLGLAIVARIIEAHRGRIVAEKSDLGARFVITLPTNLPHSSAPRTFN